MQSTGDEWQQFRDNYMRMSKDELCALAEEAYDLTEIAREALRTVIAERGFTVQLRLAPPTPLEVGPPEDDEGLVTFAWPDNAGDAWRWMKCLTAAGIPSFLGPDNVMHLEEFQGRFDGPVSLKVRDVDRSRASAAVAEAWKMARARGEAEDLEWENQYAILCPKCRSAEVVFQGRDSALREPPPTAKFLWRCDACGYAWTDDGIAKEMTGGF